MASTRNTSTSWYSHPVYARYWQHYYHAMAWMHSHQHAYRKATESYFLSPWCFLEAASLWNPEGYQAEYPQAFDECRVFWQDSQYNSSHFEGPGQSSQKDQGSLKKGPGHHRRKTKAPSRKVHTQAVHEDKEIESGSDEIECDVSNMEITEELRQYFAETERHREERRRQQQLDEERLCDYVNADHGLYYSHRSVKPPCEPPGERRQAEMKRLYGESASKILAMETAVQLNFDKHCDRKQPKYWPVIPLKF